MLFNEVNVVLGISRELIEGGAGRDVFSPSGEISVDSLTSAKVLNSGGERTLKNFTIKHVVSGDFDCRDSGKDIKLG